jgi:hypothetical protein
MAIGLIGAIVGAIVSGIITFKSIRTEKRYDIEIQVITEKILNPLFEEYYTIQRRKREKIDNLVSPTIFEKIQGIFKQNTCWYFVTNKKIKPLLIDIRDCAESEDQAKLVNKLEELYNFIEKLYVKKYS